MPQTKLILLYGGKSGEHEVSLRSAASVLTNLDANRYEIIPIAMDKKGKCHVHEYQDLLACTDSLPVISNKSKPLKSLLSDGILALSADVVFPIAHGPLYEDGCLQGILELANVAYVGSDVLASALCMDKDMSRRIACAQGVPCARYKVLSYHHPVTKRQQLLSDAVSEFGWPLFVKPCSLGSSVGIHKATTLQELGEAVNDALRYEETILIEEYLKGREIELAVLENSCPTEFPFVSKPGEIKVHNSDGFYSYTAKYSDKDNKTELIFPAVLKEDLVHRLQQAAGEIFLRLKCKGMARVDFFVDDSLDVIYFNEINTLPGFTSLSMYPKLWEVSGKSYVTLLNELIDLALTHHRCRQHLVTDYL